MAFAPYSPILFGVSKEAVNDDKLCFKDSKNEIFEKVFTKFFHLIISKVQLNKVNNKIEIKTKGLFRKLIVREVRNSELFKT